MQRVATSTGFAVRSTALLVGLALTLGGCVGADEDTSELASEARNVPINNGCSLTDTVASCIALKKTAPSEVCAFARRTYNAIFMMVDNGASFDGRWRFERYVPMLPASMATSTLPLGTACAQTGLPTFTTVVPTQASCASFNGLWNTTYNYCYWRRLIDEGRELPGR